MSRIHRLLKLHKLYAPFGGDDGSDASGAEDSAGQENEGGGEAAGAEEATGEAGETPAEEVEEVAITLGDEAPAAEAEEVQRAPEWVRELRKQNREKDRRIRELEQRVASATPAPAAVVLGEKPTLEGCDFDAEKFGAELEAWHDRKREVEAQQRTKEEAEKKARESWQTRLASYAKSSKELKVSDFEDAEDTAKEVLSVVQQGIILNGAENPAPLVYALGKNPKKLKELAAIEDPIRFAFAVGKLETQLKVTPRKAPPPPEKTVRGGSGAAPNADAQLAKLQAEADRTGDRTKVAKYLREHRQAA
jgi:hypothetical protein